MYNVLTSADMSTASQETLLLDESERADDNRADDNRADDAIINSLSIAHVVASSQSFCEERKFLLDMTSSQPTAEGPLGEWGDLQPHLHLPSILALEAQLW